MRVVRCPCGAVIQAETDDEIVQMTEAHVADRHPEMVGRYSREQILLMVRES